MSAEISVQRVRLLPIAPRRPTTSRPIRTAMIAMTTSSSTMVKPAVAARRAWRRGVARMVGRASDRIAVG